MIRFTPGNAIELLRSGGEFFPALMAAVDAAQREVWLETYIFADDVVGKQVAEVLTQGVRKSDCVARLGGDEFAVLLERADEATAVETAQRVVGLITDCEFCFKGMCLPLSIAVGIAVIEPNDTPETVMSRADKAMYREKAVAA